MEVAKKIPSFAILIVGNFENDDFSPVYKDIIKNIGIVTQITFQLEEYNKQTIENHLICACNLEINAVIIIGNTKGFSTIIHDTIKESANDIFDELSASILDLAASLKRFNRGSYATCGIRDGTLLIGMGGFMDYICALTNLITNKEAILQIINLIRKQYEAALPKTCISPHERNSAELTRAYFNLKEISGGIGFYKRQENIAISVKNAIDIIRNIVRENEEKVCVKIEEVDDIILNRILAKDIHSRVNVPSCRTSTKHGFAVLASDGKGVRKVLSTRLMSPGDKISVVSGTCMRVRSGSVIPDGATAVVMLENTKIMEKYNDYDENEIDVLINPEMNENIRNVGCEIEDKQCIFKKYSCIGQAELNILISCDLEKVPVIEIPLVGHLRIEDEGEPISRSNNIYNGYDQILIALLRKNGYDPINMGIFSQYEIIKKIQVILKIVDVLVIMGFANDKDLLKSILKKYFKATIHFSRVDIKPGKSTMLATCTVKNKKKYILCMSANPVTVPIVAQVLLLPLLNEMHCNYTESISIQARINSQHALYSRPKFLWTTLRWAESEAFPKAYCWENEDQNMIKYQKANAFLILPPRTEQKPMLNADELVQATFFGMK